MILSILLCISFISPAKAQQPNNQADAAIAAEESAQATNVSAIQGYLAPFVYERERFRDPFETQAAIAPLQGGQVYGPFLPLQYYRLADFKLVGLIWKTDKPVALFIDPEGKEHRLTIKDYIGENFGYIASIRDKEVVIIQTIEENQKRFSTTKVVFFEGALK